MATHYPCVESQLACMIRTTLHSASHKNEVQHQHDRENVRQPIDLTDATAERLDNGIADESKRKASAIEYDNGMPMMIRKAGIDSV